MTNQKHAIILILILLISLSSSISYSLFLYNTNQIQKKQILQFQMYLNDKYDMGLKPNHQIVGLAFEDYIAVYTKGRTITEVLETCTHEYSHNNLDMGHNQEIRTLQKKLELMKVE